LSKLHLSISGGGGVPACSRTIYGPREVPDNFHRNLKEDECKRVLAKIEMIYREVELDSDSLESGYCCCLGLLNPKANILVNGSIFCSNNAALSPAGKGGDMAQRSLDGLITFLTCLFPYLPVAEALAYLDAMTLSTPTPLPPPPSSLPDVGGTTAGTTAGWTLPLPPPPWRWPSNAEQLPPSI
jgi:hypothetical protein